MSKRDRVAPFRSALSLRIIARTLVDPFGAARAASSHYRLALLHIMSIFCQSHCHSVLAPEIKAESRALGGERSEIVLYIYLSVSPGAAEIKIITALYHWAADRMFGIL